MFVPIVHVCGVRVPCHLASFIFNKNVIKQIDYRDTSSGASFDQGHYLNDVGGILINDSRY